MTDPQAPAGTPADVTRVPYGADPFSAVADHILAHHGADLPDLSRIIIVLPQLQAAPRLRAQLLEQAARRGHQALLGPRIHTLRDWVEQFALDGPPACNEHARLLMLVEALLEHPKLYGAGNPWQLCDSLLELFDALTLSRAPLPERLDQFTQQLHAAYGACGPIPEPLGREARLVHTLWQAWHAQLDAERRIDRNAAYALRLTASLRALPPDHFVYLVGIDDLSTVEAQWVKSLLKRRQAALFLHGQTGDASDPADAALQRLLARLGLSAAGTLATTDAGSRCLDQVYLREGPPLVERARSFARDCPQSPLAGRLAVFQAHDLEQEALAVDIQVRRWLLEGRRSIGIITEDRRLARRIRALLERAGILLQDAAGWALSTTSAAAALERWLETVEEDFAHLPLMDLLKSPFVFPDREREPFLATVYRLEQDVILHENIGRGLERYRRYLSYRSHRLPHWTQTAVRAVRCLLDDLERAARPLMALRQGRRHAPQKFLDALTESLRRLGLWQAFNNDPAGARIVEEIEQMRLALPGRGLRLDWQGFRTWLGRTLEQHNFRPATAGSPVQLLNLAHSHLSRFEAAVIAGASRDDLPGRGPASPFFNDAVRRELGLPAWRETLNLRLHHFRRLLECAPRLLVTVRREQDGEAVVPSPWLEALQVFHRLAYGHELNDPALESLVHDARAQVVAGERADRPAPQAYPTPAVIPALLPDTVSVSAHQRLIDCPYQFFAADCLGLKPKEEIRTALEKSDYGERVHRCLQAFHHDNPGLPGPFGQAITRETRAAAIRCLLDIAAAVFAEDTEDNFMHRGWLKRWQALIPAYIDWQIEREADWRIEAVEMA